MDKVNSNTQKVVKGISSQTIVTLLLGVEGILYFSVMSRLLSREDFGFFAAVTAITTVFSSFSDAGIGSALIQQKEMSEDFKNTAFTLSVIIGGIASLLLVAVSGLLAQLVVDSQLQIPLMIMAITIFFNGMVSVNFSWMRRYLHFLRAGIIMLVAHVISSIIAIIMAYEGYGYYSILGKVVISSCLTLIISYFYVQTSFSFCLKKSCASSILNFGGWLTASVILNNISSQIDRLLMSRLLSVEALGAYNRPKEFVLQIGMRINGIFDTALFPVLSGIQDQKESLKNAFMRSTYYLNLCSMGMALAFICNTDLIIRIFFGEDWLDLKILFQIVSLSLIFNINGRLGDCYLRSLGLVRQQFNLRAFELILSVAFIVIGFRFGLMGVAVGFLLANIVVILIKVFYLSRKLDVSNHTTLQCLLSSWMYSLYFVPLIMCQHLFHANTWIGNIVLLSVFVMLMALLFLAFPLLVGRRYKEEAFLTINSFVKSKLHKV